MKKSILRRRLAGVGRRIKAFRDAKGITQEVASDRSGIGYKRWQVIEGGTANITLGTLYRIAIALRIKPFKLLK